MGTFGDEPTSPAVPSPGQAAPLAPVSEIWPNPVGGTGLVVTRGPYAGVTIPVSVGVSTVGRSRDCDVTLDSPTVSRCHAQIHHDGVHYTIIDMGSLNGTYVNREPVDRARLVGGDEIWIGTFRFTFRTGPAK
ncbi:FHA domain-containing protein [Saccharopolyspora sp. K220]|uniref:FHA domain-containing protein n=1 Tax=Saccharopolyspora soli TaxID=2926618 RepID=UPI001F5A1F8E|nr:FHA domain-containing protein [Saccharopolyspora soli]MCI2417918.1 FHA domain-containing protein [Saccharopolyspora soli]